MSNDELLCLCYELTMVKSEENLGYNQGNGLKG